MKRCSICDTTVETQLNKISWRDQFEEYQCDECSNSITMTLYDYEIEDLKRIEELESLDTTSEESSS